MTLEVYSCNHKLYNKCTLLKQGEMGLAIIQQRFNPNMKVSWWGPIDNAYHEDILTNPYLHFVMSNNAERKNDDGIYPTIELRKLLWQLKIKSPRKEDWETRF